MPILEIVILIGLVRLLAATHKPTLCAGIYAFIVGILVFMQTENVADAALAAGIGAILSYAYFWLLDRFEHNMLYYVILIAGFLLVFI